MSKARVLRIGLLLLLLLLMGLLAGAVWARSSDGPAVDWQVLSGGGAPAVSGSGAVALNGTLGQTAIGFSSIGSRVLGAGFWYGVGEAGYQSEGIDKGSAPWPGPVGLAGPLTL